jgi:hypothetical protein
MDPKAALLYLDVHRALDNVPDVTTFGFGSEVYHPVCKAYGVPVVSVRDAVWPVKASPRPELWATKAGAHPLWSGHQLIADLLAFAWTVAANRSLWGVVTQLLDPPAPPSSTSAPAVVPVVRMATATGSVQGAPYLFEDAGSRELEACPDGKYLSAPPTAVDWLKPSRSDTKGWQYVDHNGKLGWEYTLAAVSKQRRRLGFVNASDGAELTRRRLKLIGKKIKIKSRRPQSQLGLLQTGLDAFLGKSERVLMPPPSSPVNSNSSAPELREIHDLRQALSYAVKEKKAGLLQFIEIVHGPFTAAQALLESGKLASGNNISKESTAELRELCHVALLAHNERNPVPMVPPKILETLPGIISFPGRFKANSPGLLVEFLRSYANYGQAIVFVTASVGATRNASSSARPDAAAARPSYAELEARARDTLRLAWVDHRFVNVCKQALNQENAHKGSKIINYRYIIGQHQLACLGLLCTL